MMQYKASLFHGIGDSHCLEVTAVVDLTRFAIDEGAVCR
jgi:hypothetical protein